MPQPPVSPDSDLRAFLRTEGVTDAEMDVAERQGWLHLLALERWILPGERRYDRDSAAAAAGVDPEIAVRFWRALGFPDAPAGAHLFTEYDVAALRTARQRFGAWDDLEDRLQQTRVMATSLARIAELWTDEMAILFDELAADEADAQRIVDAAVDQFHFELLPAVFDFIHRRQLVSSLWRRFAEPSAGDPTEAVTAVGFCDLVGYTTMSQEMSAEELSMLVGRFEAMTHDAIAAVGGRVIKRIGDAVMFAVDDPSVAVALSLDLLDLLADADLPARVGVAYGPVVAREGDAFGKVVNLASRLVSMARPGRLLVSENVYAAVEGDSRLRIRFLGRRRIKDIGFQRLWAVKRGDR